MSAEVTWRIGMFVTVEVVAHGKTDAIAVADSAAGWPGDWMPPLEPVSVTGKLNGHEVSATIIRSQCLTIYKKEEE